MNPAARFGSRDRRVLAIGALIVLVLLGWAWVWEPLRSERLQLRERVGANADLLALARARPMPVFTTPGAPRTGSLLARADASVRAAGLGERLGGIEPQGRDALRLQIDDVAFDVLAAWLQSLAVDGIAVEAMSVQRAASAGHVDARVVLRDAGA